MYVIGCRRGLPWTFNIANNFVLKKIHERIGLDQCKIALTGAAPIHIKTIEHFMRINIPLLELYGMSEDAGPHSFNMKNRWRVGSVGQPMNGVYCKIDNPDENGEGEVRCLENGSQSHIFHHSYIHSCLNKFFGRFACTVAMSSWAT